MSQAAVTRELCDFVSGELAARANPRKAPQMAAYMKTDMPFYGVQKPERLPIYRGMKDFEIGSRPHYEKAVRALWKLPHREEKYAAIQLAKMHGEFVTLDSLPLYESLIRDGAWWDLVDDIAAHLVGTVWKDERAATEKITDAWIGDADMWIRRTAIIGQIRHKERTDAARLFRYCVARAHEKEFFIRKAIGWSLREYSYAEPDAVIAFLDEHRERLSGLSVREGSKVLKKRGLI